MTTNLKNQFRFYSILVCCLFLISNAVTAQAPVNPLKVIIIRHGEKPKNGDNLNCQGLNRSAMLPAALIPKFGVPAFSYVPSLTADSATKHARMFQTITPLAAKYNLVINSKFNGKDSSGLASDILRKQGNVLVVWDHKMIVPIIHAFGIADPHLKWDDDDFDSIWIITFKNGAAVLSKDKEGLQPSADCK